MKLSNADSGNQFSKASSSSDMVVPVFFSKTKSWSKPTDQMDSWLDTQGFYRKHIARDASSLFRCVSEVVFLTQVHHLSVRRHCIQFALYQKDIFRTLTDTPVKDYIDRLSNPREWGTPLDMEIMSLIYGLDFAVYKEIKKPLEKVTNNGFQYSIILSMSFEHHYDSVYPKQHINDAGVCQSILYEILYKHVFKLEEVDYAVNRMLHDKSTHYPSEFNTTLYSSGIQMRLEMRDNCRNVKDLLNYGITPFPYKVAKALDPTIYRNVEYDTWNEQRKGLRHSLNTWNDKELQEGSRCLITFTDKNHTTKKHGYIQQMSPNKGPVVVYIEELGEKLSVPFESLELVRSSSMLDAENSNENCYENSNRTSKRSMIKDAESADNNKRVENIDRRVPALEGKSQHSTSSIPDLCHVHYVHPTTTVVPSNCYACITSQTFPSEGSNNLKSTQVATPNSNNTHERAKGNQEVTTIGQAASMSMQYTLPMYPIVTPEMSVPPTVMQNLIPSKTTLTSNEYIDNTSSVRMMYNRSLDSYYKFGYPTSYPYYYVPSNVIYPTLPSENCVQQNADTTRMQYSYPLPQVPNDITYALPAPASPVKAELQPYPTTPLVHPAAALNVKNSITMASGPSAASLPATYPAVSSTVCPVPYAQYSPPVYYHPYEYYFPCQDIQSCESVPQSFPVQSYMPIAYPEDTYPTSAQIYCQSMLPVSHA